MTEPPAKFSRMIQWLQQRQQRVLDQAYTAAQEIKALETQYYQGNPIAYTPDQQKTIYDYVRSLRDRKLLQVRVNLTQFRFNGFLLNQPSDVVFDATDTSTVQALSVLDKLNFIESVIGKYRDWSDIDATTDAFILDPDDVNRGANSASDQTAIATSTTQSQRKGNADQPPLKSASPTFGFLRRGWLGQQPDPQYEQKVVQKLRSERKQNQLAIRWLAILILVPLLVGLISRHFILNPLLGSYADQTSNQIELSAEIQQEFSLELLRFRETLEIQELLGIIPELAPEERRDRLAEKATELWKEAREAELNGLKNLLADLLAIGTFVGLIYCNRRRLRVLRNASNRTFLSLNDPVKVFIFILITDMFVGFHSAEGWSVLLNGFGRHLGLPENEAAVGLFIATIPVFMDSCIKFWIFNYLTRFSPASAAVYERMNT